MADEHPQAPLTVKDFADSLYHSTRTDNQFKFLKNLSEGQIADFLQQFLRLVNNAMDDEDTSALIHFVQQQQMQAYQASQTVSKVRPDLPAVPLAPLRKPLNEAKIALFTSGAIYRDDQPGFYPEHLAYEEAIQDTRSALERVASLRVIPAATPLSQLRVGHIAYDIHAAQEDVNVIFPLTRFHELAQEGVIGALAEKNYSFHGLTNIQRLRDETTPQWAQMLKDDGVDAVFLTPG